MCSINFYLLKILSFPSKFEKQNESLGISKEKAAEVVGNQKQPTSINKIPDTQNKEIINSELQEIYSSEKSNNSENLNDNPWLVIRIILKMMKILLKRQNNLNNVSID